jgi:ribosomal protein S28E/S33
VNLASRAIWRVRVRLFAGAAALVVAGACGLGSLTGPPGPNRELDGHVLDDGGSLPGGGDAPIAGVRIEVLDGPKKGTVVVSDAAGNYKLPPLLTSPVTVSASKNGFDGQTETFYPDYFVAPYFRLGKPPHTLWGDISFDRSAPLIAVPHVRVEIVDGTNAGRVVIADENGRFRFDDLVASPRFLVRLSKEGYTTRGYDVIDFRLNQQRNFQIGVE